MDDVKATEEGVFKVVTDQDLERATRDGWRLAKILPTTVMVGQRTEVVVIPAPTYNGGGNATTRDNFIPEYGTTHRFLVRLGHDEHVAEMSAEIARQAAALFENGKALGQHEAKQRKMQAELDASLRSAAQEKETSARLLAERETYRTSARRMELDLGKVRKELGEREFTRIVGGET